MAALILGKIKGVKAIKPLIKLFGHTNNTFLKIVILDALGDIGTDDTKGFIKAALNSHISLVRNKAKQITDKKTWMKK